MCNRILSSLLALGFGTAGVTAGAPAAEVSWWTTHALAKVRPHDPRPGEPEQKAELCAARNEFEPFQIVLQSARQKISGVDVDISDLVAADGYRISAGQATVYLEKYIDIKKPSSVEGATGEWPDALIPRVDRYTRERRNAFPFSLEPGRNQILWVELYVPPDSPAGVYKGGIKLTGTGMTNIEVPVALTVWNFDLPSTSSLRTAFGFSGPAALRQHRGRYTSDEDLGRLTSFYGKSALLHRLSLDGATMVPPRFQKRGNTMAIDWRGYDSEVGPFLNGTVLTGKDPLPGAKATSVDLRTSNGLTSEDDTVLYWKEWIRHFRQKGWLDRLYRFVWDEPSPSVYPQVIEKSRVSRRAGPELKNLLTVPFDEKLLEFVDIWVPLINCLDSKPGFPAFCEPMITPENVTAERRLDKEVWWYQSCASHGCGGGSGNEYFRGWPSYAIDSPAISNRIMPWVTWKYRMSGELYYSMDEAYGDTARDPWKDQYLHGGNGDGTLFYPGRPEIIGGKNDIPIESIRLKLIREGLEDYEYFVLLSKVASRDEADCRVAANVTSACDWKSDPATLYSARKSMGEFLSAQSQPEKATDKNAPPKHTGSGKVHVVGLSRAPRVRSTRWFAQKSLVASLSIAVPLRGTRGAGDPRHKNYRCVLYGVRGFFHVAGNLPAAAFLPISQSLVWPKWQIQ